ncbi:MAG: TOBE domain-containing protein [Desulfobacteraceae bacterium]|nr:TOBE domain-containing protein [Desulfobacteraceae bacterium]
MKRNPKSRQGRSSSRIALFADAHHGRIISGPDEKQCIDMIQLNLLEGAFREWVARAGRPDIRLSRQRIWIIFLLIRYTGAKLSEVLALNPLLDIDLARQVVRFRGDAADAPAQARQVQISTPLARELQEKMKEFRQDAANMLAVDPGFVRRKFYERALACGLPKHLAGPEMIRKARAVELMQGNMPLPAVQRMLGHSTPNLTSSYVSFSEDEVQQVAKRFMERESARKTSARNSFLGKISNIQRGDIQTRVVLATIEGHSITALITNDSANRIGLKQGRIVTAEVKAPWIILHGGDTEPESSADNRFKGTMTRISRGKINTECVVRISDTIELCAVVSTEAIQELKLNEGDEVWALFNCFSVVLHVH